MTCLLGLSSSKKALMSKPISNEGRKERVMDKRTTDVPSNSKLGRQHTKVPVAAALSPTQDVNDVWRLATPPGSTSSTLFEQWCGFFYVPQEPNKCKCSETGPTVFPRGGTQRIFIRGGSAPRSNPLPIYTPFLTEKGTPLVYLLLTNGTPFTYLV